MNKSDLDNAMTKSMLDTAIGRKVIEQITVKNIKTGFGHDLCGVFCDFYLGKKKMGYLNDDGWGGEVDIQYANSDAEVDFKAFLVKNKVAQLLFENGWGFMDSPDKITLHTQAESVINLAIGLHDEQKNLKKIMKLCDTAIVVGTVNSYKFLSWGKLPLKAISLHQNGKAALQKGYDRAKSEMKDGDKIFNTNLAELGVIL